MCTIEVMSYFNSVTVNFYHSHDIQGHYTGTGKIFDQNKKELLCVEFDLRM